MKDAWQCRVKMNIILSTQTAQLELTGLDCISKSLSLQAFYALQVYCKHRFYALITKGLENLKQNHRKDNNAQEMPCTTKPTCKTTARQWTIPQRKQKIYESDPKRIRRTKKQKHPLRSSSLTKRHHNS